MPRFAFTAGFSPAGGQPEAIKKLAEGVERGQKHQVLMGVTGSGKTMVVAQMIQEIQRPTLVMSPNKTLAAQLCSEFRSFFPQNAVEYFVSYYDYYQPEAYIPRSDTYIEKDSSRNDEIDRLRQSATRALLTRRDVIVVASVSCIYGVGSPEDYLGESVEIHAGEGFRRDIFLRKLTNLQYQRNDVDFGRSRFRVRGDTVDVQPSYDQIATRVQFNGDDVERIVQIDPLTGEVIGDIESFQVFPATHYVTPRQMRRDRELLAASHWPPSRPGAVHADGLPARRHAGRRRRVTRGGPADRRHVRRRPVAENPAGRLWLPPALGARQPAADVCGMGTEGRTSGLRHGHPRAVRGAALPADDRGHHPADRPGRPDGGSPTDKGPDRRPDRGEPQAGGQESTDADHRANQKNGGRHDRLFA